MNQKTTAWQGKKNLVPLQVGAELELEGAELLQFHVVYVGQIGPLPYRFVEPSLLFWPLYVLHVHHVL